MMKLGAFLIFVPMSAFAVSCPTGMVAVEYDSFVPAVSGVCDAGYKAHDIDTVCGSGDGACWVVEQLRNLCTAGITSLNTSGGLAFPLYAEKSTSPSIYVRYNNMVCYGDLEVGLSAGAVNVAYNDVVYHLVAKASSGGGSTSGGDTGGGNIGGGE